MAHFNFKETLDHFSHLLQAEIPHGDLEKEGVELTIHSQSITMLPASKEGGIILEIILGLMLRPIPESRLKELMSSNFLGVNTGGCKLTLDEEGVTLYLRAETTPSTPPQDNWEWLHRLLSVAGEWIHLLSHWEEFIPLMLPPKEFKEEHIGEKV